MENTENSFKIDVIRHVDPPYIQEEMVVWFNDETASRTSNNAKKAFL